MDATGTFAELYGREAEVTASAHGRVNLIGEHTDYNGGFVLPTPVPQATSVEMARRDDDIVRVSSAGFTRGFETVEYRIGHEAPGRGWLDYLQGITLVLASAGHRVSGADMRITSDVPAGSGLASSAALEVAALRAWRSVLNLDLDDVTLALAGQKAEREFVGAPVGIMDQMVASVGERGQALWLDTRALTWDAVPLPAAAGLVVIDSGIKHANASGDYRVRRSECERAAALLGVGWLCALTRDDLARLSVLPVPLDRRARHAVTENLRVGDTVRALRRGDLVEVGVLLSASHASMRDDYEVSTPEVDALVDVASAEGEVYGARLTGGGFGGAVLALTRRGSEASVARRVVARYQAATGRTLEVLVPLDEA
jgi:galactokinase